MISWTRASNVLTRAFNLLTHAFNFPTRVFNLATRAFSLLTCGFKLVTRAFKLVTCRFELVTHGFELATRNSCFTFLLQRYVRVFPTRSQIRGETLASIANNHSQLTELWSWHCVKSVQTRIFLWSVFSCILAACRRFGMVRISDNGRGWK